MNLYHILTCDSENFYVEMPNDEYMKIDEHCREGGPTVTLQSLIEQYDDIQGDFVNLGVIKQLMSF